MEYDCPECGTHITLHPRTDRNAGTRGERILTAILVAVVLTGTIVLVLGVGVRYVLGLVR